MTSENKTTNRLSFDLMERSAIDWFPKPNSEYFLVSEGLSKPYMFCRSNDTSVLFFECGVSAQFTVIDCGHVDSLTISASNSKRGTYISLDTNFINGVIFPVQPKHDSGRPLKQQVVLARFHRATQKQHVVCNEMQNLHADILNTALPFDLIDKYFSSYKPKACSPDSPLNFWIRTIVTHRKDTQTLVDVCREIIASDGTILGQACYDVENKVIYRYVRDDKTPFRAWQSIGVEVPSDDPINLQNWPRKERVGLCSEETLCSGATVSDVWNVPESDRLKSWTKVTDRSHGYLKYQCLNTACSYLSVGVGRWMLDTELQCKNILEISPIVDHVLEWYLSAANKKNEKSSDVTCTCVHVVPQPDPKPIPSDNSMDVSANPVIGVAENPPSATVPQPPVVAKNPEFVVSEIRFKASIRLKNSNCNPMSTEWSIDCSKSVNNLKSLLYVLKAWSDGSYFNATDAMDRQMEYNISDMTIVWRNVDEFGNSSSRGCSSETRAILKTGMENSDGIVVVERVTKQSDIDLFYHRIDYLVSALQKLV